MNNQYLDNLAKVKPCKSCSLKGNLYMCKDQKEDVVMCIGDYKADISKKFPKWRKK